MNKFAYRRAARNTGNVAPEVMAAELERIWSKNGQKLLPADVVSESRPKTRPLHPCFDWDDKVAGEYWRVHQARQLIREVKIVTDDGQHEPLFVHVRVESETPKGFYQSSRIVRREPAQYAAALDEARRYLGRAMESFEEVRRLANTERHTDGDRQKLVAIMEALATAKTVAERLQ